MSLRREAKHLLLVEWPVNFFRFLVTTDVGLMVQAKRTTKKSSIMPAIRIDSVIVQTLQLRNSLYVGVLLRIRAGYGYGACTNDSNKILICATGNTDRDMIFTLEFTCFILGEVSEKCFQMRP